MKQKSKNYKHRFLAIILNIRYLLFLKCGTYIETRKCQRQPVFWSNTVNLPSSKELQTTLYRKDNINCINCIDYSLSEVLLLLNLFLQ